MFGGRKKIAKRMKKSYLNEEAYLDTHLSKGEAERRAWKALSYLATNESAHRSR